MLPDDTGTNGQALTTDGSGNLSFRMSLQAEQFMWDLELVALEIQVTEPQQLLMVGLQGQTLLLVGFTTILE